MEQSEFHQVKDLAALLFSSGDPLSKTSIKKLLNCGDSKLALLIAELKPKVGSLGLVLVEGEKDLALATSKDVSDVVNAYTKLEREGDLTPAALQVLTLVAYLDAPTKHLISYIRGVQSMQSIKNLLVRGLIEKNGHDGYVLTIDALTYLGVSKVDELPEYERMHKELLEKVNLAQEEEI